MIKLLVVKMLPLVLLQFGWSNVALAAAAVKPWAPLSEIEAAAKKEASLVFYVGGGYTTRPAEQAMSQLFEERYGIKIQWNSMPASDIPVRVITEDRTKQNIVDLVFIGFSGNYTQLNPRGVLAMILAPSTLEKEIWRLEPASVTAEDRDWLYTRVPMSPSFLINTRLVPPNEVPGSYQDLLDPRWKGRIVLQTPAVGGSGSGWFDATYRTLGVDYMRALAKQVVLVKNPPESPESVARGQAALAIAPNIPRALALIDQGAPMKFVHPKEGSHFSESGISMARNAPHPNAAKLFLQWFYTKEGQTVFAQRMPAISVRKDVAQDALPEGLRYIEGAPFLRKDLEDMRRPERTKELRAMAKQIFEEGK
jgi:iron(III) transport system substrate-binding protein